MVTRRKGTQKKYKPEPKNGTYFVALMVSGHTKLYEGYKKPLADVGVLLAYHWPRKLEQPVPPADIDLVFMIADAHNVIGRKERAAFSWQAREHDVFVIETRAQDDLFRRLTKDKYQAKPIALEDRTPVQLQIPPPPPPPEPLPSAPPPPPQALPAPLSPPPSLADQICVEPTPEPSSAPAPQPDVQLSDEQLDKAWKIAGEWVREARLKHGITVSNLATSIGISAGWLYSIETGKARPTDIICASIENVLSMPPHTLPRVAKRQNHQYQPPPDKETKAMSPPALCAIPDVDIPKPVVEAKELTALQKFMIILTQVQIDMEALGIEYVEISPTRYIVKKKTQ